YGEFVRSSCNRSGAGQQLTGGFAVAQPHEGGAVEDQRGEGGEGTLALARVVQVRAPLEEQPGRPDGALVRNEHGLAPCSGGAGALDRLDQTRDLRVVGFSPGGQERVEQPP